MKYSRVDTAGEKAFKRMDKSTKADPELDVYLKLGENELKRLADIYGPEKVDEYIAEMEKRRVKDV